MATRFLRKIPGVYTVQLAPEVHGVYRVVEIQEYGDCYCLMYRGTVREAGDRRALDIAEHADVVKTGGLLEGFARPPEWKMVAPAPPSEVYEPLAFLEGTFASYAVDFAGTLKRQVLAGEKAPTVHVGAGSGELFKDGLKLANGMEIEELALPPYPPHDGALLSDYFDDKVVTAKMAALDQLARQYM